MEERKVKVNVLTQLPLEYYDKLKGLCYGGKSVSKITREIVMNFIDRTESVLKESDSNE